MEKILKVKLISYSKPSREMYDEGLVDVQELVIAGSLQEDIGRTRRLAVSALFSMKCLTSLEQHCSC